MEKYRLFDHTADIGMEIFGRTKQELFSNAAWALENVLLTRGEQCTNSGRRKTITVEGADVADLLINFLRELLYLFNGLGLVMKNCTVAECRTRRLVVQLVVEPFNDREHVIKTELKAVTYHGLNVEKIKTGWKARVIFDV